eukprot:6175443-Pleurochrysis_carterae.AAC.3
MQLPASLHSQSLWTAPQKLLRLIRRRLYGIGSHYAGAFVALQNRFCLVPLDDLALIRAFALGRLAAMPWLPVPTQA